MKLKHIPMCMVLRISRNRTKKKGPTIGQKFRIPREGAEYIETYLYYPKQCDHSPMPVMFNIHGGGFVGCDATLLDTQSQEMADRLSCFVVNINYTKLDKKPFPYPQEEIRDTVLYFAAHSSEYDLDSSRFTLIGYSAGGHLAATTAIMLKDIGFPLNSQILCYPCLDLSRITSEGNISNTNELAKAASLLEEFFFPIIPNTDPLCSPAIAPAERLRGLAPTLIITCGQDALMEHSERYFRKLTEAGVRVEQKNYHGSVHGFMEVNYPETKDENVAKNREQQKIMREAEDYIRSKVLNYWNYQTNGYGG